MGPNVTPFKVSIPPQEYSALKFKLQSTRWPAPGLVTNWSQGVPDAAMKSLVDYWRKEYNMSRCEGWFNLYPQFTFSYSDDRSNEEIHFLHVKSKHTNPLPMLLIHGWPGSVLEFRHVIDPLVNPTAHDGQVEDAFELIIPSLPGYAWSSAHAPWTLARISTALFALMRELGFERWVVQGGDWGADIAVIMASTEYEPQRQGLVGVHINTVFFDAKAELVGRAEEGWTDGERLAMQKWDVWEQDEDAYFHVQRTRPQTLGYSLADSPTGQAAWMFEKIHGWSQHSVHQLAMDEVLDNITLYWLSNTGSTSARLYGQEGDTTARKIDIPIGASVFPGDQTYAPRSWGEKYYKKIVHWRDVERGGHFAAWEVPDILVREVRDTFRHVRT